MKQKATRSEKKNTGKNIPGPYTPKYGVIVLCDSEKHQEKIYKTLKKEGHQCKIVTA